MRKGKTRAKRRAQAVAAKNHVCRTESSDEQVTCDDPKCPVKKDWTRKCENCGSFPVVDVTGLCGPCTFGDASTAGGNW